MGRDRQRVGESWGFSVKGILMSVFADDLIAANKRRRGVGGRGGGGGEASSVVPHGNHATLTLHIQPLGGLHNPMMEEESMEPRHNLSDAAFLCSPSPTRAINKTADGIDSDCWYSLSSRCLLPTAHQFHSTLPPPSLSLSLSPAPCRIVRSGTPSTVGRESLQSAQYASVVHVMGDTSAREKAVLRTRLPGARTAARTVNLHGSRKDVPMASERPHVTFTTVRRGINLISVFSVASSFRATTIRSFYSLL